MATSLIPLVATRDHATRVAQNLRGRVYYFIEGQKCIKTKQSIKKRACTSILNSGRQNSGHSNNSSSSCFPSNLFSLLCLLPSLHRSLPLPISSFSPPSPSPPLLGSFSPPTSHLSSPRPYATSFVCFLATSTDVVSHHLLTSSLVQFI